MPRSGYRSSSSATRVYPTIVSAAASAKRLPSVVACAATLWVRATITVERWASASSAIRAITATRSSRITFSESRISSCSVFSVTSRDVMPRWMDS